MTNARRFADRTLAQPRRHTAAIIGPNLPANNICAVHGNYTARYRRRWINSRVYRIYYKCIYRTRLTATAVSIVGRNSHARALPESCVPRSVTLTRFAATGTPIRKSIFVRLSFFTVGVRAAVCVLVIYSIGWTVPIHGRN